MDNGINTLIFKEQSTEISGYGYKELLSDQQIYSILQKTKKLQGGETPQEVFSIISDIVYHIYAHLRKTPQYNPDTIWNLSTRQLLTKKEVFFMNTCLEYSLLTLQYMKQAGFHSVNLIINELATQYPGFYKLHFGIEGIHDNNSYYINNHRRNTVNIGLGNFESDYTDVDESVVNTIAIPGNMIGFDDKFQDLCQNGSINLKYFSPNLLNCFKEKFKKDNTPEEWQNGFIAKVNHPEKPEIIIKNNII